MLHTSHLPNKTTKLAIQNQKIVKPRICETQKKFSRLSRYATQQLKEFDGKKLKSTTKEGLDIDDEDRGHNTVSSKDFKDDTPRTLCETNMQHTQHKDEKKKIEELKAEFEPLTKLMKEVLGIIMDSYGFVDSNGVDGHNLH